MCCADIADMKKICIFLLFVFGLAGCSLSKKQIPIYSPEREIEPAAKGAPAESSRTYLIQGKLYAPVSGRDAFIEEGIASWYGKEFHGRKTANGEIFDMYKISAAHKTLPFGTYVKVLNLANKKEIVVKINDRGPFVKGRILDFSFGAAKEIGLVGPGITRIRLTVLSRVIGTVKSGSEYVPLVEARDFKKGKFTIQVGAFKEKANADRLADRLKVLFDHVTITNYISEKNAVLYRVRVSQSDDLAQAEKIVGKLEYMGFTESFIVAL